MRFFWRYARDKRAAKSALFSLQIRERGLSGKTNLFVAVVGESFQCPDRRGGRGETQRFHRSGPQRGGPATEQAAARLCEFYQRLHGGVTGDPAARENQLSQDVLIFLFFHRDDQRHREGARPASTHTQRRLDPHLG